MIEKLHTGAEQLGLDLLPEQYEKLETYIDCVLEFNKTYNLMKADSKDELAVNHVLDSLAAVSTLKDIINSYAAAPERLSQLKVGDIGSGGGLPGIPLAAAFSLCPDFADLRVELVERMEKRCSFLENCAAILGLKNVTVVNSEAERVEAEEYDLITFRAFRPLDKKMTKTLLRIVKAGGFLCAYKAKEENIKEEMSAISMLVPDYEIQTLKVPGLEDSERNLVVIRR